MGPPFTISLLQLIITLLTLSECLPISTGGAGKGDTLHQDHQQQQHKQHQQHHQLNSNSEQTRSEPPVDLQVQARNRAVIQNIEKLWIHKFQESEYFRNLPKSFQENVKEFLKSRTRDIFYGAQSFISQENKLRKNMPSYHESGSLKSIPDTHDASNPESAGKKEHPDAASDITKSDNVTLVVVNEDNTDHRSKRSSERYRQLDNHISSFLSDDEVVDITYTHVVPCVYADRYYCLNGGTCVFVGALDLKTCRCPMGFTGLRCEMIDQEYILSLLTNSIMFD